MNNQSNSPNNPNGAGQASSEAGRQAQLNEAALRAEGSQGGRSAGGNGQGALSQGGQRATQGVQGQGRQMQAAQQATPVLPAVDIFEDAAGVTIMADLPGVSRERLGVRIDGDNLVIEGSAETGQMDEMGETGEEDDVASSGDMEMIYGEVLNPLYRRSFTLSRDLDASRIEANLNHGVLKLVIPKAEAAKPRRIDVQVG